MGQNASCCQENPSEVPKEVVLHKFNENEDDENKVKDEETAPRSVKDIKVEIKTVEKEPEAGHRLQKPMSGSSRIEKMEQLAVDHEIVRGIALRESLRNFGRLWRWSPLDLAEEDRKRLWNRSTKVEGFDTFLSHTWLTKGRWKVLTLLLRSGWHFMLLGWFLATLLAIVLCLNGILPMAAVWTVTVDDWTGDCDMSWWIWVFGISGGFAGLFLSVYIPEFLSKSQVCFLDVACLKHPETIWNPESVYILEIHFCVSTRQKDGCFKMQLLLVPKKMLRPPRSYWHHLRICMDMPMIKTW